MKSARFISATVIVFIVATFFLLPQESFSGITADRALASVNDDVILLSDYAFFAKSLGLPDKGDIVEEGLLKRLIEQHLILQEAKRRQVQVSDVEVEAMVENIRTTQRNSPTREAFESELAREGLDMGTYRNILKETIMMQKLIESEVDSRITISDEEVDNFYQTNQRDFLKNPEQADIELLFFGLSDDASVTEVTDLIRKILKITSQLDDGETFGTLVAQYRKQTSGSAGKKGIFKRGELIGPLDMKVFTMEAGEISEPVWVKEGVYIVKLLGRSSETFKSLDEAREEIHTRLYKERKQILFSEWVNTLWEKATISIR